MRESQRRMQPAINPDAPLSPNERKAAQQDLARKALRVKENEEYYKDFFASTLPRMMRILDMADAVSERLTQTKLDVPSRKEKK